MRQIDCNSSYDRILILQAFAARLLKFVWSFWDNMH